MNIERFRKDTKEESEQKACFKLCPGAYTSCFNDKCFYWYRFY